MSHFNFETEVNELIRLDAPITTGPQPRWKRKAEEEIVKTAKISTPMKSSNRHTNRTPSRSPKPAGSKTPGKPKTPKTPSADRFIPNRSSMKFDASYFKVVSKEDVNDEENVQSPSKAEFRKSMTENLCANDLDAKILTCTNKAPAPREGKYFFI